MPSYGAPGTKRQFCKQHARPGMINVASKKCGLESCGKVHIYCIENESERRRLCMDAPVRPCVRACVQVRACVWLLGVLLVWSFVCV